MYVMLVSLQDDSSANAPLLHALIAGVLLFLFTNCSDTFPFLSSNSSCDATTRLCEDIFRIVPGDRPPYIPFCWAGRHAEGVCKSRPKYLGVRNVPGRCYPCQRIAGLEEVHKIVFLSRDIISFLHLARKCEGLTKGCMGRGFLVWLVAVAIIMCSLL